MTSDFTDLVISTTALLLLFLVAALGVSALAGLHAWQLKRQAKRQQDAQARAWERCQRDVAARFEQRKREMAARVRQ